MDIARRSPKGPLLLLVFASRAVLTGLEQTIFPDVGWARSLVQLTQWVLSVLTVAGISGIVFKVVPDTRIGWRAVTRGALLTSLFFNVGNWLLGLYLALLAEVPSGGTVEVCS